MAFLEINGLSIPVKSGSFAKRSVPIGSEGRAFDGTYRTTRRATKQQWAGQIRTLQPQQIEAIQKMIEGHGDVWQFISDRFSSKGVGTSTETGSTLMGFAADGDPVEGESIMEGTTGSLAVFDGWTNECIIPDTESSSWGFFVNASVDDSTTDYFVDTGSRILEFNGASSEVGTNVHLTAAASTTYTISFYAKAVVGDQNDPPDPDKVAFDFDVEDTTNSVTVSVTSKQAIFNKWRRFQATITTGGSGGGSITLKLLFKTSGLANRRMVVDGIQVEEGDYAHPFSLTSQSDNDLRYDAPSFIQTADVICTAVWARGPFHIPGGTSCQLININDTSPIKSEWELYIDSTNVGFRWRNQDKAQTDMTWAYSGSIDFDDWNHYVAIIDYRATLPTGRARAELWVNGTLRATANPSNLNVLPERSKSSFKSLDIGNRDGAQWSNSFITDVQVLPWHPSEEMVAAWYALGNTDSMAIGPTPRLRCRGDFDPRDYVDVHGQIEAMPFVEYSDAGAGVWRNNAAELGFTLFEV